MIIKRLQSVAFFDFWDGKAEKAFEIFIQKLQFASATFICIS